MEGTYSEIYPNVRPDENGLRHLFQQFSTPGSIPNHVSAPTPNSIHEGNTKSARANIKDAFRFCPIRTIASGRLLWLLGGLR